MANARDFIREKMAAVAPHDPAIAKPKRTRMSAKEFIKTRNSKLKPVQKQKKQKPVKVKLDELNAEIELSPLGIGSESASSFDIAKAAQTFRGKLDGPFDPHTQALIDKAEASITGKLQKVQSFLPDKVISEDDLDAAIQQKVQQESQFSDLHIPPEFEVLRRNATPDISSEKNLVDILSAKAMARLGADVTSEFLIPSNADELALQAAFAMIPIVSKASKIPALFSNPKLLDFMGGADDLSNGMKKIPFGTGEKEAKAILSKLEIPENKSVFDDLMSIFARSGETTLTGRFSLKKVSDASKELGSNLLSYVANSQVSYGKASLFLDDLVALVKREGPAMGDNITTALDTGIKSGLSDGAKTLVVKARKELDDFGLFIKKHMDEAGMKVKDHRTGELRNFELKTDFFPRQPNVEVLGTKAGMLDEMNHLIKTGQVDELATQLGKTKEQTAFEIVSRMIERRSGFLTADDFLAPGGPFSVTPASAKYSRKFDIKNFIREPVKALDNHFQFMSKFVNRLKIFGPEDGKLGKLLQQMEEAGENADIAQTIAFNVLGRARCSQTMRNAMNFLGGLQVATKLSTASVANLPQGVVNSYLRSGSLGATMKGLGKAMTTEGKRFAQETGAVAKRVIDDYISMHTGVDEASTLFGAPKAVQLAKKLGDAVLSKTGFVKTEIANRIVSANAGREYAQELLGILVKSKGKSKLARKELELFGLDPDNLLKTGKLVKDDLLLFANNFVRRTQFVGDPLSLPMATLEPIGKELFRFKTFTFNQAKMLKEAMALRPATTPFRLMAVSNLIGVPMAALRSAIKGRGAEFLDSSRLAQSFEGFETIGGSGLPMDILLSGRFGARAAVSQLAGPTISDLATVAYGTSQAATGNPVPLARFALRSLPVVGTALSRKLFPSKKEKERRSKKRGSGAF